MEVRVGCKKGENGGKGVRWEICRGVKRRGAEGKNALKDAKRKKKAVQQKKSQREQRRRNEKRKVGEKAKRKKTGRKDKKIMVKNTQVREMQIKSREGGRQEGDGRRFCG